jgi:SNF family Na+-dependent transporter
MHINNEYDLGDIVYLRTDPEQNIFIVTGILITAGGLLYKLAIGTSESVHYGLELSKEKDILLSTLSN